MMPKVAEIAKSDKQTGQHLTILNISCSARRVCKAEWSSRDAGHADRSLYLHPRANCGLFRAAADGSIRKSLPRRKYS